MTCPIDHVKSLKHGGLHHLDNLAFSCVFCNRYKGTDVGTFLSDNQFIRFFNPRIDIWSAHFQLDGALISPKTEIGKATIKILRFNDIDRLIERQELIDENRYPHPNALRLINK